MIRPAWWFLMVCAMLILWEECGENRGIFCYRMIWEGSRGLRASALFPNPVSVKTEAACCNPSFTSYTRFTTLKEFNN